jgi:hypothetical protein
MVPSPIDPVPADGFAAAAHDKWRAARRTRELAAQVSLNRDRETLTSYAEELEREAEALEHQADLAR